MNRALGKKNSSNMVCKSRQDLITAKEEEGSATNNLVEVVDSEAAGLATNSKIAKQLS
jgi:hypothetical protein